MRKGKMRRRQAAATAVEYALLIGLLAVAVIAAVTATGRNVAVLFGGVANRLGDEAGIGAPSGAGGETNDSGNSGDGGPQAPTPVMTLAAPPATVAESAGVVTWTVALSAQPTAPVTVDWTLGPSGAHPAWVGVQVYRGSPTPDAFTNQGYAYTGTLTFAPGDALSQQLTFNFADDQVDRAIDDMEVAFSLSAPQNATLQGAASSEVAIMDDDAPPVLTLARAGTADISENGGLGQIQVTVTGSADYPITVPMTVGGTATPGSDYTTDVPASVTLPAYSGSTWFYIYPQNDNLYEGANETVTVQMGQPDKGSLGASTSASFNIVDYQSPPYVIIDPSQDWKDISENGGSYTFQVKLNALSARDTHVPLHVMPADGVPSVSADDYTLSTTTVVIPAGQLSAPLTVTGVSDGAAEGTEWGFVKLDAPPADEARLYSDATAPPSPDFGYFRIVEP